MTTCHDQYDPALTGTAGRATVEVAVAEPELSFRFYRDRLGFLEADTPGETHSTVCNPGGEIVRFRQDPRNGAGSGIHLGFRRDDVAGVLALRERLRAGGVSMVDFEEKPDLVSVKVRDPDGYLVELFWEPQPAP